MLIIPPGYAQILHSISLIGDAEPMAVTYGVQLTTGAAFTDQANAQSLHTKFITAFDTQISNQYSLESTTLRRPDGETPTDPTFVGIHTQKEVFNGTDNPLPQNCAWLIQKRSGLGGRRRRGRMYMPAPAETVVGATGIITAASVTAMQTQMNTWLASIAADNAFEGMVILHSSGVSAVPTPTPVSQLVVDSRIATQRRRLRK
jgi:hypothetical protein